MSLRANARTFDLAHGTVRELNAALHQLDPSAERRAKVTRSANGVGLQEVVGPYAGAHETAEERFEDFLAVVDAREKDRLIIDRKTGVDQTLARGDRIQRELSRMVEVGHDPDRVVGAQRRATVRHLPTPKGWDRRRRAVPGRESEWPPGGERDRADDRHRDGDEQRAGRRDHQHREEPRRAPGGGPRGEGQREGRPRVAEAGPEGGAVPLDPRGPEEAREELRKLIPMGRLGEVADVVATIMFLISPGGDFYCGQTLSPNGGDVML